MSYGIDGLGATLIGVSHFGLGIDFTVLILITAEFFVFGSWLFSKIQT